MDTSSENYQEQLNLQRILGCAFLAANYFTKR